MLFCFLDHSPAAEHEPRMVLAEGEDYAQAHYRAHALGLGHPCEPMAIPEAIQIPAGFIDRLLMGAECRRLSDLVMVQTLSEQTERMWAFQLQSQVCVVYGRGIRDAWERARAVFGIPGDAAIELSGRLLDQQLHPSYLDKAGRLLTAAESTELAQEIRELQAVAVSRARGGQLQ